MANIRPINGHVLIKPIKQETTLVQSDARFEERGEVIACDTNTHEMDVGLIVYFDSWLCAKYQDGEGNEHWLVPYEKIRAFEIKENESSQSIPK